MDIPRKPARKSRKWFAYSGAAILLLVVVTAALARMDPAAPSVDRATLWTDTVRKGEMMRQVRGPGTLVAENIRWISAVTQGRVERKLVQPGTTVAEGAVLVELSNPDVERQALEAQRQLTAAEAELTTLRTNLQNQLLTQQGAVAQIQAQFNQAQRQAQSAEALARQNMVSSQELATARDNAADLQTRLNVERQRLDYMRGSMRQQIAGQEGQVTMLRRLAAFNQTQIASMQVRSPQAGVLQELPVELGQWVNSGATLAKVVQPGTLKAVLRIPETQAKDLAVGQPASIDTRNGVVPGRVTRIDPAAQNGTVTVDVALTGPLPRGARPDMSVDGTVDLERLGDVLHVGRPAYGQAESTVGMFRLLPGGHEAERVSVQLGRGSATAVEIVRGLNPGDVIILSDMSQYDAAERVRLK
ncbi:efflux RND transporter periplasmic adaptor subunit [Longimicrobium sp.]|uniref:efflux RND transporter periplasmic adaptor subunit n=1 Tax=Longimicrobium sp. TaxID=2029185 RepID=UPI002BFF6036|nr:HlyD family efflux transporter periplasmic adaptor subunit [Longimicrobium sp.]HSU17565.1 HlyD family efflux transporter periplasmic adaptor subunit [Longimicrobium sp.]